MSLDDPTKKMSKSRPAGCLFIDDAPEIVRQKIKTAVTDSGKEVAYDPVNKAAVSNLMSIYKEISGISFEQIEKNFKGKGYGEFKNDLAEKVVEYFSEYRDIKEKLLKQKSKLEKVLNAGSKKVSKIAQSNLGKVKIQAGLANK